MHDRRVLACREGLVELLTEPSNGPPVGAFRTITTSDASGRVTAVLGPDTTMSRGTLTIRARVPTDSDTVEGTASLEIIAPPES